MKTRDKILACALELFNKQGIATVSSRNISDQLGISYGNLCYHFPKKDDIILALFQQMQEELNREVSNLQAEIFRFDFMVRSLRRMMVVVYQYKFIYLDLTNICRKFPDIAKSARAQNKNRMMICRGIYAFLSKEGYLKAERAENHYDRLVESVLLMLNFWLMDAEIYYEGKEEDKIDHYLELIYRQISASMTIQGSEAFMEVYNNPEWLRAPNPNP
ncbi:TetR/AcrR family transcriptional regulator [Pontibacter sp. G13]|uniref:TetR/AcrR family transcriptional regulator n=1 Tax=Pontibacter sp. G13 TaxID=3074898 RepID=UPI00288B9398|nr:TetR/AcrR family transcriptional regulator [Pontibacter sp. G13]WNJ19972.1 TetR/AcrR family transcriptional regulator [Pontibacter sp. G13]